MNVRERDFQSRIASMRLRLSTLSTLRRLVPLPHERDITPRQWSVIESQLAAVQARLQSELKATASKYLIRLDELDSARALNSFLGSLEFETAHVFNFFDTYLDILTQRLSPELGSVLAGCDALAWDAINKEHPALSILEPPLVHCDRGFASSALRQDVALPGLPPNPVLLVQIPYSRLRSKLHLSSILHECGHQVASKLALVPAIAKALRAGLEGEGAPQEVGELFSLFTGEMVPDFWTFCGVGAAEVATIKEILSLPPETAFRISLRDPHPPPYLRVLISIEWCRQLWGRGPWDEWEDEWRALYPLDDVPKATREILEACTHSIPLVARILITTKLQTLNKRRIQDLFDLGAIAPKQLERAAKTLDEGRLDLKGLSPSVQLAVFRAVRETNRLSDEVLDKLMTDWLVRLGMMRLAA